MDRKEVIYTKVNEIEIQFDVLKYLEMKNVHYRMVGINAMICCPFHHETDPSFGININTGLFRCFSGSCGAKGNISKFIQRLEGLPGYESAESWLILRYAVNTDYNQSGGLVLQFGDEVTRKEVIYIGEDILSQYNYRHPYLLSRGITELWQDRFRIGFDRDQAMITMPWFDRLARCVGIKKRSVIDKEFRVFKLSEEGPNKLTIFGIHHFYRKQLRKAVIVEGEIDAMWCWQNGFPALALGTSAITDMQLTELKNTYIDEIIIATDNDAAGVKITNELMQKVNWIPNISQVDWGIFSDMKDVNMLNPEDLKTLLIETSLTNIFSL